MIQDGACQPAGGQEKKNTKQRKKTQKVKQTKDQNHKMQQKQKEWIIR